jgi:hypothetical protein
MFINHVAGTNPTEFTYMESKVAEQLLHNEVDWVPVGRALALKSKYVDEVNSTSQFESGSSEAGTTAESLNVVDTVGAVSNKLDFITNVRN